MLDRSDPRASMASYGAATANRAPATEYAPADYVRFYGTEPQERDSRARTWYGRGQNFVIAYSETTAGATFSRSGQPDEHVLLLPERSTSVEVTTDEGTRPVGGYSISFLPPGDSSIRVTG